MSEPTGGKHDGNANSMSDKDKLGSLMYVAKCALPCRLHNSCNLRFSFGLDVCSTKLRKNAYKINKITITLQNYNKTYSTSSMLSMQNVFVYSCWIWHLNARE